MSFRSKQLKLLVQRLAALCILLIVLSGIVPPVFATSTADFCPLMAKSAPVLIQNDADPICDIRLYLKRNQPPQKPKTWWQKFWSSDNFTADNTATESPEKRQPRVSFQHNCCNVCCVNASGSSNQQHTKSLIEMRTAEIRLPIFKAAGLKAVTKEIHLKQVFGEKSQPRAPPFFN